MQRPCGSQPYSKYKGLKEGQCIWSEGSEAECGESCSLVDHGKGMIVCWFCPKKLSSKTMSSRGFLWHRTLEAGASSRLESGPNVALSPSPAEWNWPLLTPRALAAGISMALAASASSLGCYALCGRLLQWPSPPPYACSRGLSLEGLGSVLAGLLGSPMGTASSFPNVATVSLLQVCGWGRGQGS